MPTQAICPIHGPYDAALGRCPYPHADAAPRTSSASSADDDLPTDFGPPDAATSMPTSMPTEHPAMATVDNEKTQFMRRPRADSDDLTQLDFPATPVMALLWVKAGPRRGKYYPIQNGTIVGRKEGSLLLDDARVSGRHAKFTVEKNKFVLWDLGTSNGTLVNGRRVREAVTLAENDLITIGESLFVLKLLDAKPARKTAPAKKPARPAAKKTKKAAK